MTRPTIKRCAIYTRKSSEEGLDQAFNSLDAQREACAAYIASQAGEGWRVMPGLYDDGGISGATMERPGLQNLLAEIRSGQVDVVVVYKIDRLTRSLADFARMVEVFDAHEVSFVSVTQAFNTTSSMGRLTLNVLLSFAQFEREVTGERIRDKIAASKAKGMWMGGGLPLGYDAPAAGSRALQVNESEAHQVREIFERYLALGSVHRLEAELEKAGIRSKQRITAKGDTIGGKLFSRGALFHLLHNKTYLGLIVHKDKTYPGQHTAIIEPELFEAVQARLSINARRTGAAAQTSTRLALTGRIFDANGDPMSPTTARGSKGKLYRYYVSAPLQQGRPRPPSDTSLHRVAATKIETRLGKLVNRLTGKEQEAPLSMVRRVEVHADHIKIRLPADQLTSVRERLAEDEVLHRVAGDRTCRELLVPVQLKPRSGRSWIEKESEDSRQPDPALVSALRQAHAMMNIDKRGLPTLNVSPTSPYRRKLIRLALLAPDIQKQILDGRQPPGLTVSQLVACDLPLGWAGQRAMIQAMATNQVKS